MEESLIAALVGSLAALASLSIPPANAWFRRLTVLSGLLLIVAALAQAHSTGFFIGFFAVWMIHRYIHPVCPACSAPLHGLGPPMLVALGLHFFADGLAASPALVLHKIPEGFATAILFQAATKRRYAGLLAAVAIQFATVAGGMASALGSGESMAELTAGSMLFLGLLALSHRWAALVPAGPLLKFLSHSQQSVFRKGAAH